MNFAQARINMLKQQCRTWAVTNQKVLDLLNSTPREYFVPTAYQSLALADMAIPLAHQQSMLTPREEAKMIDALAIQSTESVLEIGTGSGYLTALLAQQAQQIESVDIFADFTENAAKKLTKYGINNVVLHTADATQYDYQEAQYDVIVIGSALQAIPKKYLTLLAMGGRLLVIIGRTPVMQALIITKISQKIIEQQFLFETQTPALINDMRETSFIF